MIKREDCIQIGVVSKTHHLQGAVIVTADNNLLEKYSNEPVFLLLDGAPVPYFIASNGNEIRTRNHNSYIVKFDYIDSVKQAEEVLGAEVLLVHTILQEDEIFGMDDFDIYDFIDFKIVEEKINEEGIVSDVSDFSGNIVLTVIIKDSEVLLPLSEDFITEIDYENSIIYTNIPQDLINLN